ncbi:MAG TPA: hypothetical protein VFQ44_00930 [Streptosporangiaceae bacterium]|nr:hypothetical protein [Streptosporangiaceae bacterium]
MRRIRDFGILLAAVAGAGGLIVAVMPAQGAQVSGRTRAATPATAAATGTSAKSAKVIVKRALPDFGNPNGHFPVPRAGRAANTTHPDHVIGRGTPSSCTSAAVVRAVAKGGIVKFNCGSKPVTILMTRTATVPKVRHLVVIDGGGLVTLSGGGKRRILFSDTCMGKWSTDDCVNQPFPKIVVQNITFKDGFNGTHQATCTANAPRCWYGGVDGGGAIYAEGGQLKVVNSRFIGNSCYKFGPDLGGGAIRALAQYKNRPVYITRDTFSGGHCSNGAALSSISVQWTVINSMFTNNKAVGWGANPAASGTPGGGSGGAIYNDGTNYNTLIAGTIMRNNTAREGGGAVFYVVDTGWGKLTLNESHLHRNSSGQFQTFPGIYDNIDGHDGPPVMINSTDN